MVRVALILVLGLWGMNSSSQITTASENIIFKQKINGKWSDTRTVESTTTVQITPAYVRIISDVAGTLELKVVKRMRDEENSEDLLVYGCVDKSNVATIVTVSVIDGNRFVSVVTKEFIMVLPIISYRLHSTTPNISNSE